MHNDVSRDLQKAPLVFQGDQRPLCTIKPYTAIQTIGGKWKRSIDLDGHTKSGSAVNRMAGIKLAERGIDRVLAPKRKRLIQRFAPAHDHSEPLSCTVIKQHRSLHFETARDARYVVDRNVALGPLNATEIGTIDPAFVRQTFLAQAALSPEAAHVSRQNVS